MNVSTFLVRILQLALVGLFIMGLFAVGFFVFLLTFGVLAILGLVYWLRSKGIIKTPQSTMYSYEETHVYADTDSGATTHETVTHTTVIDGEFQEIEKK
jgi:cytoskeletal protein RodZ